METWVLATVAAACFQNIRFSLQKVLKGRLSTMGVTYARFLFGLPFVAVLVAVLLAMGEPWPGLTPRFWWFALAGAIAQIVATALLIALFSLKNFAVGVTFTKTETVSTLLLSAAILGEGVGGMALLAIAVTLIGVVMMSGLPRRDALMTGIFGKPALMGIGSGAIFSVASIGYRGASLALEQGEFLIRASVTLFIVVLVQTAIMTAWLIWREPGEVRRTLQSWRLSIPMGFTSAAGSLGWFIAFTLVNATYVKAVGQIELLFTYLTSVFIFRERASRAETSGIVLVAAGILLLLFV